MASIDTPIDHSCDAWQADSSIIPNDVPPRPYDQFYIKICTNFTSLPLHAGEGEGEDYLMMMDEAPASTTVTEFWLPSPVLLTPDDSSYSLISEMLSQVGVPLDLHPFMIHRISVTARSMATDAHNVGRRVLPMLVNIDVIQYVDNNYPQESVESTVNVEQDKVARAA